MYKEIAIKDINVLDNIRQKPVKEDLAGLMTSIKQNGLMQAIGVKEIDGGYVLLWGYRRLQACKKLGHKLIEAKLFKPEDEDMTEEDFLIINAAENVQRKTINAIELGRICSRLREGGLSVTEIAARLSIPKSRVTAATDEFSKVPESFHEKVVMFNHGTTNKAGKIGMSTTSSILAIKGLSKEQRMEVFHWATTEEKSAEQVRILKGLLDTGMTLKKAMKEVDNWKICNVKLALRQDVVDDVVKKFGSERAYVTSYVKNDYGDAAVV
jgi:ParB family chromosome partitioning protein